MDDQIQINAADNVSDASFEDGQRCRVSVCSRMFALLASLFAVTGCATYDNHYSAAELPFQLYAPPNENTKLLDLSNLSGGSSQSDLIGHGDVLQVDIAASLDPRDVSTFAVRVGDDGQAILPLIGPVQMVGMELEEAEAVVTQASVDRGQFRSPHVTLTMKKKKSNRILVIGAVKEPGIKQIPSSESDLLSILSHAGGLADDAGTTVDIKNAMTREEAFNAIAAKRSRSSVTQTGFASATTNVGRSVKVDLISAVKEGRNSYYVGDGGVVYIKERDPEAVHVLGLVRKPGRLPFPLGEEFHVLDAIAEAGYTSSQVADKVYIVRQLDPSKGPFVIQASLRKARHDPSHNLALAPGDLVSVEHTPATILMEAFQMIRFGVSSSLNPLL